MTIDTGKNTQFYQINPSKEAGSDLHMAKYAASSITALYFVSPLSEQEVRNLNHTLYMQEIV